MYKIIEDEIRSNKVTDLKGVGVWDSEWLTVSRSTTYEVSMHEIREGKTGQSEQHAKTGVQSQVLINSDVVLRIAAEVMTTQQIEQVHHQHRR